MAYQNLRNEYLNMPPVTRAYTTACVITTLAVVSSKICLNNQLFLAEVITNKNKYTTKTNAECFYNPFGHALRIIICSFQQLELASPFQLYFNPILIVKQGQIWRLVTTFLFFGTFGFNFFFNMIFTYRYCRMLEEGSFRNRTADFVLMFMFGAVCMIVSFYDEYRLVTLSKYILHKKR